MLAIAAMKRWLWALDAAPSGWDHFPCPYTLTRATLMPYAASGIVGAMTVVLGKLVSLLNSVQPVPATVPGAR